MEVSYFLNTDRKSQLYCRISDGSEEVTFSLEYETDVEKWDVEEEFLSCADIHYLSLIRFEEYLTNKYHELKKEGKTNILDSLKNEALLLMGKSGIEGIAQKMFNYFNSENGMPAYDRFIEAFEKYTHFSKGQYSVEILEDNIYFHARKKIYEMDTYDGLICRLNYYIESKSYEDIIVMTQERFWSDIHLDGGTEKSLFLPAIRKEWEEYWNRASKETNGIKPINEAKLRFWKQFEMFMERYDSTPNTIRLAYEIDNLILYPVAVIALFSIYDAKCCYDEYCGYEFYGSDDWDGVTLNEDTAQETTFFIRTFTE